MPKKLLELSWKCY